MIKYSPKESLRNEVERFKNENNFNPLQVTNFYVQAGLVLDYVEELEMKLQEMIDRHDSNSSIVSSAKNLIKRNNEY